MIGFLLATAQAQPLEAAPPRYLTEADIRTALLEPDWQSCVPDDTADLTAPLTFRIPSDGRVEVTGFEAPEALAACWSDLLSALQFRAHDEEPLVVEWTLGVHQGSAVPYPAFQLRRRQLRPFFLFIPSDADPEAVGELLQVLEVAD